MFDKLFEAQQKAEEIKKRLDTISVSSEVEGGKIKVIVTANKHITSISIDPGFLANTDAEELEELLTTAVNKALEQAESVSQTEMQAATRDMIGGLGNLFGK
ncbi:MAG: YbaB/EbfC family nucleoid-associated protein [Phormidesmis sp. FL-bin-119]|nr:YbaB/EbfC family nucleoid-associated protein [Pedobacter sp.]